MEPHTVCEHGNALHANVDMQLTLLTLYAYSKLLDEDAADTFIALSNHGRVVSEAHNG